MVLPSLTFERGEPVQVGNDVGDFHHGFDETRSPEDLHGNLHGLGSRKQTAGKKPWEKARNMRSQGAGLVKQPSLAHGMASILILYFS